MSEDEFGSPKKIKVEIGRSAEIEALRTEKDAEIEDLKTQLEEKKSLLEQQALTEFEKEKKAIMELLNSSELSYEQKQAIESQLENPANMELIRTVLGTGKPTKKPPYGKSTFLPPTDSSKFNNMGEVVENLYDTAFYNLKATLEEKADARKKINDLWHSFETGKSISQIRDGGLAQIMKSISECPECHRVIPPLSKNNPTCIYCNYDVREKHEGRKGNSLTPHVGTVNGEIPTTF